MEDRIVLGKYASIIYRQGNRYYDRALAPYLIGCGQQFFLLRVYENQGISVLDLARLGRFDKGTATRAVRKLEEQGYLRSEPDPRDKRVRRLYATQRALPIVEAIYRARRRWSEMLTCGMSEEEQAVLVDLLARMAENALSLADREE